MSSETNGKGNAVTLPVEEVLRLTTLNDDEVETEPGAENQYSETNKTISITSRSRNNNANNRRKSKSPRRTGEVVEFERKTPGRTRSGSSTGSRASRKVQKAIKNEKKSVDELVAAAIRKYEDDSPQKSRTTPGRTKSGSSSRKKKKSSSEKNQRLSSSPKKKGRRKRKSHSPTPPSATAAAATATPQQGINGDPEAENNENVPAQIEIGDAGAIAVYPSDSDRSTTRRDRSAPHRISDISTSFAINEISGTFSTNDEEAQLSNRRDSTLDTYEEEVPEPPQSQVIHAVATYHRQDAGTSSSLPMQRAVSDSESLTTAPLTVSTDAETGTVTARAVSSENYYQEVRRQLEKEAVAAVAVIPLSEDGKPITKQRSPKRKGGGDDDDSETLSKNGRSQKKLWVCGGIILALVLGVAVGVGVAVESVKSRRNARNSESDASCGEGTECYMDSMNTMMNSEEGQYWRQRITRILPRNTLVSILEDPTFMTPQYRAFNYLVSNTETLFGFTKKEMMEMDMVKEFTPYELSRVQSIFALVTLYYSMNGSEWYVQTNWLQPHIDICDWHGVECHGEKLSPTSNNNKNNKVNGEGAESFSNSDPPPPGDLDPDKSSTSTSTNAIVDEAFELDKSGGYFDNKLLLHSLILMANNLRGSIPEEISMLSNIYGQVNLGRNNIHGKIPSVMGELKRLQALRLDRNDLSSTLPPDLANMASLKLFDISNNPSITGDVIDFQNWSDIAVLKLENTKLTGTIPPGLCDMLENRESFDSILFPDSVLSATCGTEQGQLDCPCCTECY